MGFLFDMLVVMHYKTCTVAVGCTLLFDRAGVAQSVEQLICNQPVGGSTPLASSTTTGRCPSGQREQTVNLPPYGYEGSNPSLPTRAGIAQMVERQPSKLNVAGSNPVSRSTGAHVAQSAERVLGKDEVIGSTPIVGSRGLFLPLPQREGVLVALRTE
jgi:hypothetical protein